MLSSDFRSRAIRRSVLSILFFASFACVFFFSEHVIAQNQSELDLWQRDFVVPFGGRVNPFNLPEAEYAESVQRGKLHTQIYPVSVTGLLPPVAPVMSFIEGRPEDPIRKILQSLFRGFSDVRSMDDVFHWIGLNPYPQEEDTGVYAVPYPNGRRPQSRMGFGTLERMVDGSKQTGFTLSCATCHSASLFGKTVLGLTNRFPRANDTFVRAALAAHYYQPWVFEKLHAAKPAELKMIREVVDNLAAVGTKEPLVLGLDTSLAQVSMSMARRETDGWALKNKNLEKQPRFEILQSQPADSKPAVWWNLKYKNRWLSDGSVISGNPIFTNILWNEVGRGVDLHELNRWLAGNENTIRDLTNAVFSIEAPRVTDFFPAEKIEINRAMRGEGLFNQRCAKCHGHYIKMWSHPSLTKLNKNDRLKTWQVQYPQHTPVKDVGTDSFRYRGMKSLEVLNRLEISKLNGTVIESQKGYVPPPLVGIWARWPYFHNNSIPSLCALLTVPEKRPAVYWARSAVDPNQDFDFECNGYPMSKPQASGSKFIELNELYFDTRKAGLGNFGHDEGILRKNGVEFFSREDKKDLIQYLQTL